MANYSIKILDSIDKFVGEAESWRSLWSRSGVVLPTVQAECIASWMRHHLSSDAVFRAIVVEADGTAVAGIPLCMERRAKVLRTGVLPYSGTLLCDTSRDDTEKIFSQLVKGLKQLPIDFLWCGEIRYEDFPWKNFCEYWKSSGHSSRTTSQHHTAVIPLYGNPESVVASWDKKKLADIIRRFRKRYTPENHEFRVVSDPDEVVAVLPDCFVVEHSGWKAQTDYCGSIIKRGQEEYYLTQAKILADQNLVRLYTLFFEGQLIAFQYGYVVENTVFSVKISYEHAMREFAPGMVLRWLIYQSLLDDPTVDYVDCVGIAGTHQKIWNPQLHTVGEVVFPLTMQGKIALSLHKIYVKMRGVSSPKTDES